MSRPPIPDNYLLGTIAYALYWLDESLQLQLEAEGWPRVSRARSMLMMCVAAGINQPSNISKSLGISKQATHQLLRGMIDDEFVELAPHPEDKRAKIVRFNENSASIRRAADKALRDIESRLEQRIGKTRFRQLKEILLLDWGPLAATEG